MLRLKDGIVELYTKVATSIPSDVEDALKQTYTSETTEGEGEVGHGSGCFSVIIDNVKNARTTRKPLCRDIGIPVFWVKLPQGLDPQNIAADIVEGSRQAVLKLLHSPVSSGGEGVDTEDVAAMNPDIYFEDSDKSSLVVDLLLKSTECQRSEELSQVQSSGSIALKSDASGKPDTEHYRNEIRDIVIDTVKKAKKTVCAPYTIGVGLGTERDDVAMISKKQLLRRLNDSNPETQALEKKILEDLNTMNVPTLGSTVQTMALGVKIGGNWADPAVVNVSICCWANRRGRLIWG
ncbi:hydro-lyase, Fe-S type, tartrate/fumarate subfamily subunit alpha [Candidatus Magnetobacterium bavaricum]|uniref:Hydro-lyase, Fe-S type, tartrate/fumarate subfamily subunit alpha n=1 Tax=Candidatus Magnetobacterium bavaricum TaxID=29290 RepID=A0A0F3GTF6_9BACT|nr:hydro-lyase, Fe-S type, tartrate/fumarate subfamily subunit alpha [Candidatus Magnetobacterium bavaricum]